MAKPKINVTMDAGLKNVVDDLRARGIRAEDIMSAGVTAITQGAYAGAPTQAPVVQAALPSLEDRLASIAHISAEARKDAASTLADGMKMGMQMMQMGVDMGAGMGPPAADSQEDRAAGLLLDAAEGRMGEGGGAPPPPSNPWGVSLHGSAPPFSSGAATPPRPPPPEE